MEERNLKKHAAGAGMEGTRIEEHVFLLGTPPIREFLELVKARRLNVCCAPEEILVHEWRRAADHIRELEVTESGSVENAALTALPEEMERCVSHELEDPCVKRSLGLLPCRWALVDLDQLIVHQRSVDLTFIGSLKAAIPTSPTDEELFRFTAGRLRPAPDVRITRTSENVYTFSSASADLRFLDIALLDPEMVHGYHAPGRAAGAVAVFVGFGANFLSALRMQGRLILINGTHRSHLLYDLGIRRVPCLVREVSCDDDLDLIGAPEVKQSLQVYLRARRPPRLKDFFDPQLRKIIPVAAASRLVHVQLQTQRSRVSIA
jgi:hypothetical protein